MLTRFLPASKIEKLKFIVANISDSSFLSMKTLFIILLLIDYKLACDMQCQKYPFCGANHKNHHQSHYFNKVFIYGIPSEDDEPSLHIVFSFNCYSCRRRITPESTRFSYNSRYCNISKIIFDLYNNNDNANKNELVTFKEIADYLNLPYSLIKYWSRTTKKDETENKIETTKKALIAENTFNMLEGKLLLLMLFQEIDGILNIAQTINYELLINITITYSFINKSMIYKGYDLTQRTNHKYSKFDDDD